VSRNGNRRLFELVHRSGIDELLGLVEQSQLVAMRALTARTEALAAHQPDVFAQLLDLCVALFECCVTFLNECLQTRNIAR
jgi:hypothetical protein